MEGAVIDILKWSLKDDIHIWKHHLGDGRKEWRVAGSVSQKDIKIFIWILNIIKMCRWAAVQFYDLPRYHLPSVGLTEDDTVLR